MNKKPNNEVTLQWNNYTKETLSSPVLANNIFVAFPPDFPKGMAGKWSHEYLF